MKKELLRICSVLLCLCCLCFGFAASPALAYGAGQAVSAEGMAREKLTLYKEPTSISNVVATVNQGEKLTVIEAGTSPWYKVRAASGVEGYCSKYGLTIPVTGLALDKTVLELNQGGTAKLTATTVPAIATDGGVIWKSSSPTVATVDNKGNVTAVGGGTAVIYATAADGAALSTGCTVTVKGGVASGVKLSAASQTLAVGKSFLLKATATGGSINGYGVVWSSSNESVATVSNGIVTARAPGTAVITASKDGKSAACNLTVTQPVTQIQLQENNTAINNKTINMSDKFNLTAVVGPSNASNKAVKWTSSDPKVAAVAEGNGGVTVTGVSGGTAVITATAQDGSGISASCKVTVTTTLKLSVYSGAIHKGQTLYNKATTNSLSKITWSSSNPGVATVSNGFIEGKGVGSATITAEVNGMRAHCTITVAEEEPVFMAYCTPNIAAPGQEVTLLVLTPPTQTSVQVKQNETVIASANSGYTDKNRNGRIVRVWTLKTKFTTEGTITLTAHAGNAAAGKSFTAYITNAAASDTPVVAGRRASDAALKFRSQYEGYCPTVVYDVVNIPTIGYGDALTPGEIFYNNQIEEEAFGNMTNLMNGQFTSTLNAFTKHYGIALRQQQFDALLNFSYNYGANGWRYYDFYLRRLLVDSKNGDKIDTLQLKYAFGRLSYTNSTFYTGLYRGRMDEWEMFTIGDYNIHPSSDMTGNFAVPTKEELENPNMYKGDWKWHGAWW